MNEFRALPSGHKAKQDKLEVSSMYSRKSRLLYCMRGKLMTGLKLVWLYL